MGPIYIDEINVCGHYLSALINEDYSGLSDQDETDLDQWFNEYKDSGATYIFNVSSEESSFDRDIVSGLMADCYKVKVFEC